MSPHLLVIDDDEASCRLIRATFKAEGFDVSMAHDGPAGVERASADAPDVVLLDIRLPGLDGLQVLERLKAAAPWMPVVMLTASRDLKTAVRATQLGAFDYLAKPIDHDEILGVVRRALETRALRLEVEDLRRRVNRDEAGTLAAQMGGSAAVKQLVEQVSIVAASNFTVLVLGETGTGKELVAQAIHRQSERRRQPLIALDCGAIPESLPVAESADGAVDGRSRASGITGVWRRDAAPAGALAQDSGSGSGRWMVPSSSSVQNGLWATSHGCPSGSMNTPE
jgi:DNA-binding NtrC family response regulator